MKTSIGNLGMESLLLFLENELLMGGDYENISSGMIDYAGNRLGKLEYTGEDEQYGPNCVYQGLFNNWVYESGVAPSGYPSPTIASGIYISGIFYGKNDAVYGHKIDYPNGRIIFNNPQPESLQVYAEYAKKNFTVTYTYVDKMLASEGPFNVGVTPRLSYPSGRISIPAILIQLDNEPKKEGYQLGAGKLVRCNYSLHIIGKDEVDSSNVAGFVSSYQDFSMKVIDFNYAPYPLDEYGDINPSYVPLSNLKTNYAIYNAEIEETSIMKVGDTFGRYIVGLTLKIYKI